jgi:hypothetical protein
MYSLDYISPLNYTGSTYIYTYIATNINIRYLSDINILLLIRQDCEAAV